MRQSALFSKTRKEVPKDETSKNAEFLIRGGYVEKLAAGIYTFLPLGFRVLKKIEQIIREEMEAVGGQEILMPALQPAEHWKTTGRWDTLDVLFRFTSFYTKADYVLAPTHEEVVSPLAKSQNLSYRDLPRYIFQIQTKFRDERRAKSGILRGREFIMKDFYSLHRDAADLNAYYEKMKDAYLKIFRRAGLGHITYLTYASGGSFSKYSHEFQTLSAAGEDIICLCKKCDVAINKEIVSEHNGCAECGNGDLVEEKSIEVGNIFKIGVKYSQPFNLTYRAEDGSDKDVVMGCYGIGLGRLMGTVVEAHHDDAGIVWPESVAPYRAHILSLGQSPEVVSAAEALYEKMISAKIETFYDDRLTVSAGEKLKDADLLGLPYRVVVSDKTAAKGKFEMKKRAADRPELLTVRELLDTLSG